MYQNLYYVVIHFTTDLARLCKSKYYKYWCCPCSKNVHEIYSTLSLSTTII